MQDARRVAFVHAFSMAGSGVVGALAEDYHLTSERIDDCSFCIHLKGLDMVIYLGFGHVVSVIAYLQPPPTIAGQVSPLAIGIGHLLEYRKADVALLNLRTRQPSEVATKLRELADIIRQYADSFLGGDMSEWRGLCAYVDERIRNSRSH